MKQIPWILIKKANHSFLKKSCWKSSFSLKYHHHKFISACSVRSFRFLKSTLQVFVGWYAVISNILLIWLSQLISYFKRRRGKYTGCSSLIEVPWSCSKRTLCCASLLTWARVKFFYFSFSLRFELKLSVLKNQTPEEEVKRACRPEKPSYASVRFCFPRPVAMLFFR